MKSELGAVRDHSSRTADEIKKAFEWSGVVPEGIVCPACFGELRTEGDKLVCAGCKRRYPILGGIPVLIIERADRG